MRIDDIMDKVQNKKRSSKLSEWDKVLAIYNDLFDELENEVLKGTKIEADEEDAAAIIRVHAKVKRKINKEVYNKIIDDNNLKKDEILLKIGE